MSANLPSLSAGVREWERYAVGLRAENDQLRGAEERALRVLYHVISTNEAWETQRPNELTDDAIRIGHEFLIDRGWWPAASGAAPYEEETNG